MLQKNILGKYYYYLHCTDEEPEVERGYVTCLRSHSCQSPDPHPRGLTPESAFLITMPYSLLYMVQNLAVVSTSLEWENLSPSVPDAARPSE